MTSSNGNVMNAALAINHLNDVLKDLRNERDRLEVCLQNERARRAEQLARLRSGLSECSVLAQALRNGTEALLFGLAGPACPEGGLQDLEEHRRSLAQHRSLLKTMEGWMAQEQAALELEEEEARSPMRRMSRLNHLHSGPGAPLAFRDSASEWGELASVSGGCPPAAPARDAFFLPER